MRLTKSEIILGLSSFILFNLFAAPLALAGTTASVTATVTAQNISLSVAPGTVSYGTIAPSGYMTTLSGGVSGQQTVTNNGNITESFNIEGADSSAWTLAATPGSEQYSHLFCKASCGTNASPTGANFTALTTSYAALATSVTTSGTQVFDLEIKVPTSTTATSQQNVNVTVQATQ